MVDMNNVAAPRIGYCRYRAEICASLLLVFHVVLLLYSAYWQSPTQNEIGHLPAGLSYWKTGNFSLYNVNPPLCKLLATAPVTLFNPNTDRIIVPKAPDRRTEWIAAERFAIDNQSEYKQLLRLARLSGIFWSVAGGMIIYKWSKSMHGSLGGLLSLALWCFSPNILAHAPLLTPDVPCAVAALAATWLYRCHLRSETWRSSFVAGIALGFAQLTKFTLLVLYPVWLMLLMVWFFSLRGQARAGRRRFVETCRLVVIYLISIWIINSGYAFSGSLLQLKSYVFISRDLRGSNIDDDGGAAAGNRFRDGLLENVIVPLPVDYLLGIDAQKRDFEIKLMSYMNGDWRDRGWVHYYLFALLVKVPLSTLIVMCLSATLTISRPRSSLLDVSAVWLPPLVVFFFVSSQTGFNHHFRYLTPAVSFVCVGVGRLAVCNRSKIWGRSAIAVLLVLSCFSSLRIYPHSLSYFNELVGGPDNGHFYLLHSNLDWSQDWYFFQSWLDEHPEARSISVAFHNNISTEAVLGKSFPAIPTDPPAECDLADGCFVADYGPHSGWFAIDVGSLFDCNCRFTYFRNIRPVCKIGYTIWIFNITSDEANDYRRDLGLPSLTR